MYLLCFLRVMLGMQRFCKELARSLTCKEIAEPGQLEVTGPDSAYAPNFNFIFVQAPLRMANIWQSYR